jgi:carboxylesterase type B
MDYDVVPSFRIIPYDHGPFRKENQMEDCLFLNVVVPRRIFEGKEKKKFPVVVWIHGGGFVVGNKDTLYNPGGLLERSQEDGGEGMIFVSMNYRVQTQLLILNLGVNW